MLSVYFPKAFFILVGTTGFELATSSTPRKRATRLRHVPIRRILRLKFRACFVKLSICGYVFRLLLSALF